MLVSHKTFLFQLVVMIIFTPITAIVGGTQAPVVAGEAGLVFGGPRCPLPALPVAGLQGRYPATLPQPLPLFLPHLTPLPVSGLSGTPAVGDPTDIRGHRVSARGWDRLQFRVWGRERGGKEGRTEQGRVGLTWTGQGRAG